jgi:hypothetical protein
MTGNFEIDRANGLDLSPIQLLGRWPRKLMHAPIRNDGMRKLATSSTDRYGRYVVIYS